MYTYNQQELESARRQKDVSAGVAFNWWLANIDGAGFALLREPHHTDADIAAAKAEIYRNRDVVGSIKVLRPEAKSV